MTDGDDKVTKAYRDLAREEPPLSIDAAILARARRATAAKRGIGRWFPAVSIAAVLVLGIGVSLRMQMEKPGVESSVVTNEAPPPTTPMPTPTPAPEVSGTLRAPEPGAKEVKPMMAAKPVAQPASPPAAPPPVELQERADERRQEAPAAAPPAVAAAAAPAPMRAKREAFAQDALADRALNKSVAPDQERDRELERIAKLREAGDNLEADRALEAFRKRYPDFRIPEAMWERVRAR